MPIPSFLECFHLECQECELCSSFCVLADGEGEGNTEARDSCVGTIAASTATTTDVLAEMLPVGVRAEVVGRGVAEAALRMEGGSRVVGVAAGRGGLDPYVFGNLRGGNGAGTRETKGLG